MIVVDASALMEVLLNRPSGKRVANRLLDPLETLHAPHLLDLEVAQVLRRYQAAGEMSPQRARQALLAFAQMPLERHPHWSFLDRASGNCAATSRLTTPHTSPWRKLWMHRFSPATAPWPESRAIAPSWN